MLCKRELSLPTAYNALAEIRFCTYSTLKLHLHLPIAIIQNVTMVRVNWKDTSKNPISKKLPCRLIIVVLNQKLVLNRINQGKEEIEKTQWKCETMEAFQEKMG